MGLLGRTMLCAIAWLACCAGDAWAAGVLAIVSSVRVEAPKGFYLTQPLRFSFTVRNQTSGPVTAGIISVPVRGPGGDGLDVPCEGGKNLTLASGQAWTCNAPIGTGYGSIGKYVYWADWAWPNGGAWHQGELGPDQAFSLAPAPLTSVAGTGQWGLGEQNVGTTSAATPVPITNTGTAALLLDSLSIGGVNPSDFALAGETCTQAPVAPGATCSLLVRFAPSAKGPRVATLLFRANTTPASNAVNLTGTGTVPPVDTTSTTTSTTTNTGTPTTNEQVTPILVPAPVRLAATLTYDFKRMTKRSTRITSLVVKDVPAGATVEANCPRGCSRTTLTTTRAGNVSLKALVRKPLKAGTKITVRVTRPGALGIVKTFTVRAGKRPTITTGCLDVAGKATTCAP